MLSRRDGLSHDLCISSSNNEANIKTPTSIELLESLVCVPTLIQNMKIQKLFPALLLGIVLSVGLVSSQEPAIISVDTTAVQANSFQAQQHQAQMENYYRMRAQVNNQMPDGRYSNQYEHKGRNYAGMIFYKIMLGFCFLVSIFFGAFVARKGWDAGGRDFSHHKRLFSFKKR